MRAWICGAAVALTFTACSSGAPQSASQAAAMGTAQAAPPLVRVVAHDFAFADNPTVPAGLVAIRLVNQGHAIHMMGVARLDSNHTVADVYKSFSDPKASLSFFHEVGGPGAVSPGDSATQYAVLEPGRYSLICWWPDSTGKPHIEDGMMATLTVTGDYAGAAVEPTPDLFVREADYHIATSGQWTAGHHVMRVDNDGPSTHDVTILRVLPGKTEAQVSAWLNRPTMSDAPVQALGGTVGIDRYGHTEVGVDLVPGDYLLLCMVGAKPHFMLGMITHMHIS